MKHSLYLKTYNVIKKEKKSYFLTLFFDVIFVLVLGLIGNIIRLTLGSDLAIQNKVASLGIIPSLLLTIIYYLIILLIYTTAKYFILDTLIKKVPQTFIKFYALNTILIPSYAIASLFILQFFFIIFQKTVFQIIGLIYLIATLFFFYPFLNFAQISFLKHPNTKHALKKAYQLTRQVNKYWGLYAGYFIFLVVTYIIVVLLNRVIPEFYRLFMIFILLGTIILNALHRRAFITIEES